MLVVKHKFCCIVESRITYKSSVNGESKWSIANDCNYTFIMLSL